MSILQIYTAGILFGIYTGILTDILLFDTLSGIYSDVLFGMHLVSSAGTSAPQQQAPDPSGHLIAWPLPGLSSKGPIGPQLPTLNSKPLMAVGTTGPQAQVLDHSGHRRSSTARA